MKITLKIDNKDREFATPFISGRKLRNTFAMSKKVNTTKQDETMLDEMVNYIVDIFGNQFTLDQFYDGIEANKIIPTFTNLVEEIIGTMNNKTEQLAIASKNA
jgi:hypothetical protein